MLGAACAEMGKSEEALDAFRRAVWLRERCGDEVRAAVTRRLMDWVESGGMPSAFAA
jgi:hypothetical protein